MVKSFYLQGYNAVEIAKKVCSNTETVRKCIQRNFGNLKLKHEIAVIQRKEELKATNYESNRYISDRAFILKNRSIYKTLPNGDIVINREVAPIITWDTPRRLVNENKCMVWFFHKLYTPIKKILVEIEATEKLKLLGKYQNFRKISEVKYV